MPHSPIARASLTLTKWIGSVPSLILHTVFFASCFLAVLFGYLLFEQMLLILTTIVSLEAIYLAIFIQMTINAQAESLKEVSEDVVEIQEDIGEIQEDVEEISEDVGEVQEDIEEIQGDVDELQEDIEEITEDVGEMSEEDQKKLANHAIRGETLAAIHADLKRLMADVEKLKE